MGVFGFKLRNMIETIINSEAFLIVISGVIIFTLQNLISQLWISPIVEFKKCLARIETLLTRYAFLSRFEYDTNGGIMNSDTEYFRRELKNLTSEMLGSYSILPKSEKWWLKKRYGIDIIKAKTEMLTLSAVVSTHDDVHKVEPRAEIAIKNIPKYLNFSEIKYKMADVL